MADRHGKPQTVLLLSAMIAVGLAATALLPVAAAEPGAFATDSRGFIDTPARCESPTSAVAIGRTAQSLVAICVDGRSNYGYRGVRLSDHSVLDAPATATGDGRFVVDNAGFTYTFSPKELVIARGARVVRTEPMAAYVEPDPPDESAEG
jgi:hypothetical protein